MWCRTHPELPLLWERQSGSNTNGLHENREGPSCGKGLLAAHADGSVCCMTRSTGRYVAISETIGRLWLLRTLLVVHAGAHFEPWRTGAMQSFRLASSSSRSSHASVSDSPVDLTGNTSVSPLLSQLWRGSVRYRSSTAAQLVVDRGLLGRGRSKHPALVVGQSNSTDPSRVADWEYPHAGEALFSYAAPKQWPMVLGYSTHLY